MKWVLAFLILALPAMAGREFVAASSQLGVGSITAVELPITLACWVSRPNNVSRAVFALNTTSNATERVQIYWDADVSNVWALASIDASAANAYCVSNAVSTITHVAAVFASTNSRSIFVNGSNKRTDTTINAANGFDLVVLGARKSTTFGAYWSGLLAEVAIWNVALTDSEVLSLSVGASPLLIRPANLKFYAPLTGRETASELNLVGAAVSLTNAPAASSDHPRIYRP